MIWLLKTSSSQEICVMCCIIVLETKTLGIKVTLNALLLISKSLGELCKCVQITNFLITQPLMSAHESTRWHAAKCYSFLIITMYNLSKVNIIPPLQFMNLYELWEVVLIFFNGVSTRRSASLK